MGAFPPLSSDFIGQLDDLQLDLYDQRNLDARHFPTTTGFTHERPILFHCPTLFAGKRPYTRSILPVQYLIVDDLDWVDTVKAKFARIHLLPALRLILVPILPRYDRSTHFAGRVARREARTVRYHCPDVQHRRAALAGRRARVCQVPARHGGGGSGGSGSGSGSGGRAAVGRDAA